MIHSAAAMLIATRGYAMRLPMLLAAAMMRGFDAERATLFMLCAPYATMTPRRYAQPAYLMPYHI